MAKICPDCGEDHEIIFSEEILEFFKEILEADKYERAELMIDMAKQFCAEADDTDESIGEDLHSLLTEVIQNRVLFERSALTLARVLIRMLPQYVEAHKPAIINPQAN